MPDSIDYDALAEQIAANAERPQSTLVDGMQQTERSLTEQIDALRFLERRKAARQFPLGQPIRVNRGDALG